MWKPDGLMSAEEIANEFRLKFISVEWGSCQSNTEDKLAELLKQVWLHGAKSALKVQKDTTHRVADSEALPEFGMDRAELLALQLIDH